MPLPGLVQYGRVEPDVLPMFMARMKVSLRRAFEEFYVHTSSTDDALQDYRYDGKIDSDFHRYMMDHLSPYCGQEAA
jgi:hypothetical protein